MRKYDVTRVTGDNYAGEWVAQSFQSRGIRYQKCDLPKSQLYLELLPRLCSEEVELLDDPALVNQLAALERRTRSGGRDTVDHPSGARDDLANAVAGVCEITARKRITVGGY